MRTTNRSKRGDAAVTEAIDVIEVKPTPDCLQDARRLGIIAGRDDTEFKYTVDRRGSNDPVAFCRALVIKLRQQPVFSREYLPQLQDLVDITARACTIALVRVSNVHAKMLYKGCPEENIKHVPERKIADFVRIVLPPEAQSVTILRPIEASFWRGWLSGANVAQRWLARNNA